MAKFIELLQSCKELDCDLIIGGVEMPASFVWDDSSYISEYGIERFKPIMYAEYDILENGTIEIFCEDYELGEQFSMAAAGYIGNMEFKRLFSLQ